MIESIGEVLNSPAGLLIIGAVVFGVLWIVMAKWK